MKRLSIFIALLAAFGCRSKDPAPERHGPKIELPPGTEDPKPESSASKIIKRRSAAMGTYVDLTFYGVSEADASRAAEAVFEEFARLEQMMSEWKEGSQLTLVNRAAGTEAVAVDQELYDLVEKALQFSELTGGAFDPTFAAMWGLWTFGDDGIKTPPDEQTVEARRKLIDHRKVVLDRDKRTIFLKDKGMKLGLGGIAKGYATDRAVAILRAAKIENFMVQAGGELYASGKKGAEVWKVGIRDPRGEGVIAKLRLDGAAFDTSGDYERFFMHEGVRYHHIIDPKTGYPAKKSRSATVLANDATTSDALSTALFVMGPEGMKLVERMEGVEAVIVDAENKVHISSGLKEKLEILAEPSP